MRNLRNIALSIVACMASACVGAPDVGSNRSDLLFDIAELASTDPVPAASWQGAPPSCEGRLTARVSFRMAAGGGGLIAAVSDTGEVVCVDTSDSLQLELSNPSQDPADTAVDPMVAPTMGVDMGDPDPQPNSEPTTPPPNTSAERPDPVPQPNSQPRM